MILTVLSIIALCLFIGKAFAEINASNFIIILAVIGVMLAFVIGISTIGTIS